MKILVVHIRVKPECVEAFKEAILENAQASNLEPGIDRFDVLQSSDDPTRFTLYEAYYGEQGPEAHRETAHYKKWKETVESMMAEPRQGLWHAPLLYSAGKR
jgi:quinol monooxygenase YgiN